MKFKKGGFTLLELLVAASIMMMVCYLILKMSVQVLDTYGRFSVKMDDASEMKLALDVIARDIETSLPYYWVYGNRFSFYGFGKDEFPNKIVYNVGEEGLYRWIQSTGKKYFVTEVLEEIASSLGEMKQSANLIAKNIKIVMVKFLIKKYDGKIEWTEKLPFKGTAICAEVVVVGEKERKMSRRIMLVGVSRL